MTGVPAEEVVALARAYATTRPAAIRRLIGIEHHREGARMVRTIACLPALVGAWRDRGGGSWARPHGRPTARSTRTRWPDRSPDTRA